MNKKLKKLAAKEIERLSAGVGSVGPNSRTRPFEVSQIRGNVTVAPRPATDYRNRK